MGGGGGGDDHGLLHGVGSLGGEGEDILWLLQTELIAGGDLDLIERGLVQSCEDVGSVVGLPVLNPAVVRAWRQDFKHPPVLGPKFPETDYKLGNWGSALDTPLQLVGMFG